MQMVGDPATTVVASVHGALMRIGRLMRQPVPGDTMDVGTVILLRHLASQDGLRLTELAACAGLDASTVSRHVAQLHRQGLLERTPDPDDGRAQRVALSPLGRRRLDEALQRRQALLAQSLEGWEPADVNHLARLLDRVVRGLEASHAGKDN